MGPVTLIATTKFGLEAVVKRELLALGFDEMRVSQGRVAFTASTDDIPRANLWLRCADRVLLQVGEFTAVTFDELYEQSRALPWEQWITPDGRFPVNARTVHSTLQSERSCQAIVKKAVAERLAAAHGVGQAVAALPETGADYGIQVAIHQDRALLTLDTSGDGLHKRGYRAEAGAAPLTETLAAALVLLSFWDRDRLLIDPMCGSGTILIEASMIGRRMAPGLRRAFAAERWPAVGAAHWQAARQAAEAVIDRSGNLALFGYDIDAEAIRVAKQNAELAGVASDITFEQKALAELWIDQEYGILISNPPYGRRMAEFQEINALYITLNKMMRKKKGWSVYILTADEKFPDYFKRGRPDRVRKLFNGNIRVDYYQYYGERP
ncbi:MAG: class I SAM-dependent RNA methyltransferase [Anaerolineae bacterium]|nr:class I SAM-dependent RNA methyltransferase [Anaerolineae bacterium]